jgi:hypothetical protein
MCLGDVSIRFCVPGPKADFLIKNQGVIPYKFEILETGDKNAPLELTVFPGM